MSIYSGFPDEMLFDKKTTEDELELIKSEYKKLLSISKIKMDGNSYQLFLDKNNKVYLPKGTLIHGTSSDIDNLRSISKNGLLAPEFNGKVKKNEIYYCIDFNKIEKDIFLNDYNLENVPGDDNSIYVIINPTSKIGGLLYYDLLESKFDNNPIIKNIVIPCKKKLIKEKNTNMSSILVGLPSNAISGFILSDKVISNEELVSEIKKLFPNSYLINKEGIIIKDRSNIIKVEDFDDMAYKYVKTLAEKRIITNENNKLKKDIKKIINSLKDNTSFYQQAKIYTELGYKIPKALLSKLTKSEIEKLK